MATAWSFSAHSPARGMPANSTADFPLSSLVYQSRASGPQSDQALRRLVVASQARNREEGLTGVLVYDDGRFLQWLEGPTKGLRRVWRSICKDRRHTGIELVRSDSAPARSFDGRAMTLAKCRAADDGSPRDTLEVPPELIKTLYKNPTEAPSVLARLAARPATRLLGRGLQMNALSDAGEIMSLATLVHEVVVPKLMEWHVPQAAKSVRIDPSVHQLAQLLVGVEAGGAAGLIETLRSDGRSLGELCAGLFEPAARALGELWQSDECAEWQVSLGLGRLQLALRTASGHPSSALAPLPPSSVPHSVLVAPSPLERHVLGSAMASELFLQAGWEVCSEYPDSDAALSQLVHERWFDVLDLSLSSVFTREHRLPQMAASIRAAHANSCNPALAVIVDGRVFHERPWAYAKVGADASSDSIMDVVSTAQGQFLRPKRRLI